MIGCGRYDYGKFITRDGIFEKDQLLTVSNEEGEEGGEENKGNFILIVEREPLEEVFIAFISLSVYFINKSLIFFLSLDEDSSSSHIIENYVKNPPSIFIQISKTMIMVDGSDSEEDEDHPTTTNSSSRLLQNSSLIIDDSDSEGEEAGCWNSLEETCSIS